jgi:SAM-dependent methyltransferase
MDVPSWYGYKHTANEKVLDLGGGVHKVPGSICVDFDPRCGADVAHDLDSMPYPFQENSIDAIYMNHCIEHLKDPKGTLEECVRIARTGAVIYITVPHFTNGASFGDITHRRYFSYRAIPGLAKNISVGTKGLALVNGVVTARISPLTPLINLAVRFWEDFFCYMVTGRALYYRFRVVDTAKD